MSKFLFFVGFDPFKPSLRRVLQKWIVSTKDDLIDEVKGRKCRNFYVLTVFGR